MSKLDEALGELKQLCHANGMEDGLGEGYRGWEERKADIAASEAAVLTLYEQQKAVADELAKAVRSYIEDSDATVGELKAALAAYDKAKEGKQGG